MGHREKLFSHATADHGDEQSATGRGEKRRQDHFDEKGCDKLTEARMRSYAFFIKIK